MNNDLIERIEKYLNTIPDDMRYTSPNDFVRMLDESLTALREQETKINTVEGLLKEHFEAPGNQKIAEWEDLAKRTREVLK